MSTPEIRVLSACMLCYTWSPSQDLFFLLAKEKPTTRWPRANRWSDLGGRPLPHETPEETAAREFTEETAGVVQMEQHATAPFVGPYKYEYHDATTLLGALQAGDYTLKIQTEVDGDPHKQRVCYVKEIPWQPHLSRHFERTQHFLQRVQQQGPTVLPFLPPQVQQHPGILAATGQVDEAFQEKQCLAWWSFQKLKTLLKSGGYYKGKPSFRLGFLPTLALTIQQFTQWENLCRQHLKHGSR